MAAPQPNAALATWSSSDVENLLHGSTITIVDQRTDGVNPTRPLQCLRALCHQAQCELFCFALPTRAIERNCTVVFQVHGEPDDAIPSPRHGITPITILVLQ